MLDQENKTNVEQSTNNSNNNNNNNNSISHNNSKLSDSNSCSVHSNPLDDHDYCSPHKTPLPRQMNNETSNNLTSNHSQQEHTVQLNQNLKEGSDNLPTSTPDAPLCPASTSSPSVVHTNGAETIGQIHQKRPSNDDGNMSDCSSSSSSISSDDSTGNLVIAQDGQKARSLAPKDTPSVSKPKLGRRPLLKTNFELGKLGSKERLDKQPRKRPRQNTSVTDKSQWITGEKQVESALSEHVAQVREKRQRKEVHDPEFSHFTSSEYSSSDAESDQESEYDVDDESRPWCDCNQPYNGEFMLECEACKYWFHGSCVGVTESLNEKWNKEGKEWFCSRCDHEMQNGTPREAIQPRVLKKEKKKSSSKSKRRRGRPKKADTQVREVTTRQSARNARKSSTSADHKPVLKNKSNARSESFEKFDDQTRLKELIRERRKEFFAKHRLSEQLKSEKIKELRMGRHSVTGSLGSSLDSVASTTTSPSMNNLPINIKSEHGERKQHKEHREHREHRDHKEHKERSTPNIVLQINTKKDSNADPSNQRIVTTIVKKRDNPEPKEPSPTPANDIPARVGEKKSGTQTPSSVESLAFLDTTMSHGIHVYDMMCKICTKQQSATSETKLEETKSPETVASAVSTNSTSTTPTNVKSEDDLKDQPQPKRLRISIPTNLDIANLSKMKEPLIKPSEQPQESADYSPSKISPTSASDSIPDEADVDNEDLYDPETSTIPPHSALNSSTQSSSSECWKGTITSSQVGKFNARAMPISGNLSFMGSDMSHTLTMCGRIPPDQVGSYIKKLKSTTKNPILLVQLFPETDDDKASFNTFFDHLYTRNRCGVIEVGAYQPFLKDFYLMPIHEKGQIPDYVKPANGKGLDRTEPNCLLGMLVKSKRPGSAAGSSSGYTPTPIKS